METINPVMNKMEVMISLLKHQLCLTSITLTGPKIQEGFSSLHWQRAAECMHGPAQCNDMTKTKRSPQCDRHLQKWTALQTHGKYFKAGLHTDSH